MHHQNSSSFMPFQANTGTPVAAIAAAAWSCVEKILQEDQRTLAPRAVSVSISTAVWIVMCRQPTMRAPLRIWSLPNSSRSAIRPGISSCAISISLRPQAAKEISLTLKSSLTTFASGIAKPSMLQGNFIAEFEKSSYFF